MNPYSCRLPVVLLLATLTVPCSSPGQSDDFNDGNDTGWTRYSPLAAFGVPGVYTFPNGGYRIQVTTPTGLADNPGRAGSVREDVTYTDFYVSVDVVDWKDDTRQAFGLLARVGTPGLGTTAGYAFTYERGSGVTMTSGDTDLSRLAGEVPAGLPTGPSGLHLDPAKDYRFVFLGHGGDLEGRIYELPNTDAPILVLTSTDPNPYPSGYCGLVVYDNSGGTGTCDATFDNYVAQDVEPPRIIINDANPATGDLVLTWPGYALNFVLECSSELPGTTWSAVTDTIFGPHEFPLDPDNPNYICFTSINPGNKFFRLRRP